ncbi:MAG: ribonuclease HI family protein [Armatimonadetes bacterium]|nr:ribonuclease HI family protein [Armatimonadota bacterium]CUU35314.1 ribonuclease HI [Armatimonadetes bacterium DC]
MRAYHKTVRARAFIDGSALNNPGAAGLAVRIEDEQGRLLLELCEPIGRATNNFAEYYSLLRCLQEAKRMGITELDIYTDLELIVKQWSGVYKVNERLRPLYSEAKRIAQEIGQVRIHHAKAESEWVEIIQYVDALCRKAAEHVQKVGRDDEDWI